MFTRGINSELHAAKNIGCYIHPVVRINGLGCRDVASYVSTKKPNANSRAEGLKILLFFIFVATLFILCVKMKHMGKAMLVRSG